MKKISLFLLSLLIAIILFGLHKVYAEDFYHIKATAYCYNSGTTSTGTIPMEGRTLAGRPEWFGKTIVVWEDKGNGIEPENYIGTFICEDTGSDSIKNGYVIDVFIEDYDRAISFGSKNVIIQLIDAEG